MATLTFTNLDPITTSGVSEIFPGSGLRRHQIDFGVAVDGSIAVGVDFFTGEYRVIEAIDLTDTARLPFVIEGCVRAFQFTPAGITGDDYSVAYVPTVIG